MGITALEENGSAFTPHRVRMMSEVFLAVGSDLEPSPFQQIVDRLRAFIERVELRPGDPLPTVRQLGGDLGVARGDRAISHHPHASRVLGERDRGANRERTSNANPLRKVL